MIVAIASESESDEVGLRCLIDAVVGVKTVAPEGFPRIETRRGWASLARLSPTFVKHFFYRSECSGLVIVGDSNGNRIGPGDDGGRLPDRLTHLNSACRKALSELSRVPERPPFRVAVGVAAPAIEAWYLFGTSPQITESLWMRDRDAGVMAPARIREMKRQAYKSETPNSRLTRTVAAQLASVVAADIDALEGAFPIGFGSLARELRAWRNPPSREA